MKKVAAISAVFCLLNLLCLIPLFVVECERGNPPPDDCCSSRHLERANSQAILSSKKRKQIIMGSISATDRNNMWTTVAEIDLENFAKQTYILHSSDHGQTWRKYSFDPEEYFPDIYFATPSTGWVVGGTEEEERIYKTIDGGKSWIRQKSPLTLRPQQVQFLNQDHGWIAGEKGIILRTTNGGIDWSIHRIKELDRPHSLYFRDKSNGWVTGLNDQQVYQSTDGGTIWLARGVELAKLLDDWQRSEVLFRNVKFVNSKVGFIAAHVSPKKEGEFPQRGIVFRTADGGRTWKVVVATKDLGLASAFFLNEDEWWVVPVYGEDIISTRDGGKSWEAMPVFPGEGIGVSEVYFTDSTNGWFRGSLSDYPLRYGIFHTFDGGKTWIERKMPDD
jgi:photosystem II stability/assembly factor-like uncharacterized protein